MYHRRSAGALTSVAFLVSVSSQSRVWSSGTYRMSTVPASNSATAVEGSGMMRAISVSIDGAPPKYVALRANLR